MFMDFKLYVIHHYYGSADECGNGQLVDLVPAIVP
jgi:hypothetical protein